MSRFSLPPSVRWVICWLTFLGATVFVGIETWTAFNQADRSDGNRGHTTIDFGGQWLMGRMIVEGRGRYLYLRNYLRPIAQQNYPAGTQSPKEQKSDADALMEWLAGTDDPQAPEVIASLLAPLAASNSLNEMVVLAMAQTTWVEERLAHVTAPRVGGALYPPIHAFYYAPLGLLRPQIAYRVVQVSILALAFFAGWVIQRMTDGRLWWPVASLFILGFPGFVGCVTLGQNGMFVLTLVLLGWWQLMRGRQLLAGLCWGLLAFKPVWAAAFLIVPLLTARWRMAASILVAGIVQVALTLPMVGWKSWQNWLQVGHNAAQEYKRQENWIFLSRDLHGIPRRWLLIFEGELAKDVVWSKGNDPTQSVEAKDGAGKSKAENPWDHALLEVLGWGLWAAVLAVTIYVAWRCREERKDLTGPFPAFVLSAAILTCYHFMYYDFVVAAVPVLLLFAEPHRYLQLQLRTLAPLLLLVLMLAVPVISTLIDPSYRFPPWETFLLLLLWAWCGFSLLNPQRDHREAKNLLLPDGRGSEGLRIPAVQFTELGANVARAHKRFADQDRPDAGRP